MDELYRENEKMIKNLSWDFTKKYRLKEYAETLSTANLIFCEVVAAEKYNPEKASFSTYLNRQLTYQLHTWCKEQWQVKEKEICCGIIFENKNTYTELYDDQILFNDILNSFPNKEKKVVETILHPEKINYAYPKITRNTLRKECIMKNMKPYEISKSFRIIQDAFAL